MAIIVSRDGRNAKKIEKAGFQNEDHLQKYLHANPECIPLYDIKEDIRFLVLAREFPTDSGDMDAIGVDKEGDIYCVETKLYKNPDKRRVVAQVLDYGAALWHSHQDFSQFIRRIEDAVHKVSGITLDQRLKEFFEIDDAGVTSLLENVKTNLNSGRFKFVVLMDKLEDNLKTLIVFLNQNSRFDIFAVEMDFYKYEDYEIMIPKLFGAEVKKDVGVSSTRREQWDEKRFLNKLDENKGADVTKVAANILVWANQSPRFVSWGEGKQIGSFTPQIKHDGRYHQFFNVTTEGKIILPFGVYQTKPPFDATQKRRELLVKLNSFLDEKISEADISRYPTILLAALMKETVFRNFTNTFEWFTHEIAGG
jgi:hypothetical protein